jgi:hypothetical protein
MKISLCLIISIVVPTCCATYGARHSLNRVTVSSYLPFEKLFCHRIQYVRSYNSNQVQATTLPSTFEPLKQTVKSILCLLLSLVLFPHKPLLRISIKLSFFISFIYLILQCTDHLSLSLQTLQRFLFISNIITEYHYTEGTNLIKSRRNQTFRSANFHQPPCKLLDHVMDLRLLTP